MDMETMRKANWIGAQEGSGCKEFRRKFQVEKKISTAVICLTSIGIYQAEINGERIGEFIFAPGCTCYDKRLQVQTYDITSQIHTGDNVLSVVVGKGWQRGRISASWKEIHEVPCAMLGTLEITYGDGTQEIICSDEQWQVGNTRILFDDIYDGETYDASISDDDLEKSFTNVICCEELPKNILIPQEGEIVKEQERIKPVDVFVTPKGETVVDFGQNLTGYVSFSVNAKENDVIRYTHAETLDYDGNVYRENYRSAKTEICYICKEGKQYYKPAFTFMGFRYLVFLEKPDTLSLGQIKENFTAIAVYSDMRRTSYVETGNTLINRLFSNVLWSQRDNFVDIPTDCPQRDERMGWTGDAQVFCQTAALNYDVSKFMKKWCGDLRAAQRENGSIPDTVPNFWCVKGSSTAWGDAICILPWTMYLMYGDESFLHENFEAMAKWVDYISGDTIQEGLWMTSPEDLKLWGKHYGDWLGLDSEEGSYIGASNQNYIASVFYYYSTKLVVKAGHVIGKDVSQYEHLIKKIKSTIEKEFPILKTETEKVLALYFDLTDKPEKVAKELANDIEKDHFQMRTGFVGTPYILHALCKYGYEAAAYSLFLREESPSWLYSVKQGATTIWEHWDGMNDEGKMWSKDMNSFNHYAYGSVFDWVYTVAAGIRVIETNPGYEEVLIAPHPDKRLGFLKVKLHTKYGDIYSAWNYEDGECRYEISSPVKAYVEINGERRILEPGKRLSVCHSMRIQKNKWN